MQALPSSCGIALTLLACLCCASALECYACNSLVDSGCDSDIAINKKYLVNCSVGRIDTDAFRPVPDAKVCWKQRQDVEGKIIVDRTCGRELDHDTYNCYDRVGTRKIKVRYCVCNRDGCNSSARLVGASLLIVLTMLVSFIAGSARL